MSEVITCIEDLRALAARRVPRIFYDYADSGSWTEGTYRANERDFQSIQLLQRVGVDISSRSTRSTLLGDAVSMPVALAPVGAAGLQHADGEILAARAAKAFGVPFTLSTMSVCSIEDVAQATQGHPFWFQLYVMRDRQFVERLMGRAETAGCSALVLTMDLQILGQRHKDVKNGLSETGKLGLRQLAGILAKPRWVAQMLRTPRRMMGNFVGHVDGVTDMASFARWRTGQLDESLNWNDVAWIRKRWKRKLILKGIQAVDDARRAVELGADALVVSNHGGRQLDGAQSSIRALPAIVEAVKGQIEVHMDSGVRSGQDVLKARALGAQGVYVGRPWVYGLGALGEQGVTQALSILHRELDLTMAFCGHTDLEQVDRGILIPASLSTACTGA